MSVVSLILSLTDKLFKTTPSVSGTIYDFKIRSLSGVMVDFSQYKGKNLLIVNTASRCGYTPQYKELQVLHEKHADKVTVLGFPANNFLWQEPGDDKAISEFCEINYGVTFQMFEKISVRGRNVHPLYRWLHAKSGKLPTWNFCKYLVDWQGNVQEFYGPDVTPLDAKILNRILN